MPTFKDNGETVALFVFNQIIAQFGIPKVIALTMEIIFKIYDDGTD